MRIRRVRENSAPLMLGQVRQSANPGLALAAPVVEGLNQYADRESAKLEARARQKLDIDFMQAASSYEAGLSELQMPEGGAGFEGLAAGVFGDTFGALAETAPEHMREEVGNRVAEMGLRLESSARKAAEGEATAFSTFKLTEALEMIEGEAARNPGAIEGLKARAASLINQNPDLDPDQRRKLLDGVEDSLTERSEIARVENDPLAAQSYAGTADAAALIKGFEGFRTDAYNDPKTDSNGNQVGANVYRTGYGSDTVTKADGTVVKVTKDTVVTKAEADHDLERRLKEFGNQAKSDIGAEAWGNLSQNAQAALTSIAYNYGNVPKRIRAAARSGDVYALADAVEGLGGDNGGINAKRRRQEAEVIRGGKIGMGAASYSRVRSAATSVIRAEGVQLAASQKMLEAELDVQTSRGETTYEELNQARDNGDISATKWAALTKRLDTYHERQKAESSALDALVGRLEKGEVANGYDADDRKAVDALDDQLEEQFEGDELEERRVMAATQTGVVSSGMISSLLSDMGKGTPEAFDRAARVMARQPHAFAGRANTKKIVDATERFKTYTGMGKSVEEAAMLASPSKEREAAEKAVRREVNKEIKEFTVDDVLAAFDTWLPFDAPSVSASMQSSLMRDFEVLYRDARTDGMDPDAAEEHAARFLTDPSKGIYGRSQFASGGFILGKVASRGPAATSATPDQLVLNGGIMRLPPERFYPPIGGGHSYVEKDILQTLNGISGYINGPWSMATDPVETDDAVKALRGGEAILPGYRILYQDSEGMPQEVFWRIPVDQVRDLQAKDRAKTRRKFELREAEIEAQRQNAQSRAPLARYGVSR